MFFQVMCSTWLRHTSSKQDPDDGNSNFAHWSYLNLSSTWKVYRVRRRAAAHRARRCARVMKYGHKFGPYQKELGVVVNYERIWPKYTFIVTLWSLSPRNSQPALTCLPSDCHRVAPLDSLFTFLSYIYNGEELFNLKYIGTIHCSFRFWQKSSRCLLTF